MQQYMYLFPTDTDVYYLLQQNKRGSLFVCYHITNYKPYINKQSLVI